MKSNYDFLPGLFLRTPFYSFADYDLLKVPGMLAKESFRNAIYLASPLFYDLLQKKNFRFDLLSDKEKLTLYKYYNRMCFRQTPFGSCSSFTLVRWGHDTGIRLRADEDVIIHLLPDQAVTSAMKKAASAGQGDKTLKINPTLYRSGGELRFVRSVAGPHQRFGFRLESTELVPFYTGLIELFKKNELNAVQLGSWITLETGCTDEEALAYIDFMLDSQILLGEARGNVILNDRKKDGQDLLSGQIKACQPIIPTADEWQERLPEHAKPAQASNFYAAAERPASAGVLDMTLQEELSAALGILERLRTPSRQLTLERFMADLSKKFDQAKVPLLEALDPDAGIAYGGYSSEYSDNELLDDIRFSNDHKAEQPMDWEPVRRLFLRLWSGRARNGRSAPIVIDDSDCEDLGTLKEGPVQPSTLAVIFRKTEDHLLLEHAGGATATALIGRFSAFSEEVHGLCRELAGKEAALHPDLIFAEISLLTGGHADNINLRRRIYDYEIPVNVYAETSRDTSIDLNDLLVSVRGGELIIESISHQKRVIPRLPTAYNFHKSELTVYRFLCDLQYQGMNAIKNIDLEYIFPGLDFYPRVAYRSTILGLAKWKFKDTDFAELKMAALKDHRYWLRGFRDTHGLPQRVSMGHEDQQLVFDLADEQDCGLFTRCLHGLKDITLYEYLQADRSVRAGYEPLAGQFITFLAHQQRIYRPLRLERPLTGEIRRNFTIGSEWLYLKIYCTPRTGDHLISEVIGPLVSEFEKEIKTWFFIRYTDEDHHLRLRIRVAEASVGKFLSVLQKRLQDDRHEQMIKKYVADTYSRELERYGEELIDLVESFFQAGSDLIVRFVTLTKEARTTWTPFRMAIASSFLMIFTFYERSEQAILFVEMMVESFLKEFGGQKQLKVDLDKKYRALKPDIDEWLKYPSGIGTAVGEGASITALVLHMGTIKLEAASSDVARKQRLLADLVHMQLNRTFRSEPRQQELLVYYCIHKFLISKQARSLERPIAGG